MTAMPLVLVLLLLPTYLIRFHLFGIPFTFLEVMIIVLFVTFGIQRVIKKQPLQIGFVPGVLLVLLLAAGIFGVLVSPDMRAAGGIFKAYILEPILFYIVCVHSIRSRRDLDRAAIALGISAVTVSVIAILQYVTGWWIPEPWQLFPGRRATAFYGYPNAIGLFVAPIMALWIGLVSAVRSFQHHRPIIIALLMLCFGGLLAARVDGGVIAVVAALGVVSLFSRFRFAALGIGAVVIVATFLFEPTREIMLFQDVSGDVRLALWKGTWKLLQAHPIFGAGLAGFPILYDLYRLPSHVELLQYPHNIFLDVWVELGALGVIWLISTLVYYFTTAARALRTTARGYAIACIAAMIAILVYGIVDVPYFKNDLSVLFWTFVAFVSVLKKIDTQETR